MNAHIAVLTLLEQTDQYVCFFGSITYQPVGMACTGHPRATSRWGSETSPASHYAAAASFDP